MFLQFSRGDGSTVGAIVGPSNAIYVDVAGNDTTGARGNAARPFLTVAAALAVMQDGDEILIGPGSFTIAAGLTLPAAVTKGRIAGSGMAETRLNGAAGIDILTLPSTVTGYFLLEDISLTALTTGRCVVGAAAAGGAFLTNSLICNNVLVQTSATNVDTFALTGANDVVLFNVQSPTSTVGSASFLTCANVRLRGTTQLGNVQHTWDNASATKPTATQTVGLRLRAGSIIGTWTGTGQPLITADPGSTIGAMTGASLSVSTGLAPVFQVHGSVGNCTFTGGVTTLPDGAVTATVVNFSGAVLTGNAYTFSDAADVTAQAINFTGVRTSAAVTLTAGLRCHMDERGSSFAVQPTYVSAGATLGTHIPPRLVFIGTAAVAATVLAFGFTAGNTSYLTNSTATNAAGTPVTVGAKTATQVTVNIGGAPAGTLDTVVTWL